MPERIPTRISIIDNLAELIDADFGPAPEHPYVPFCPHCVAHQAVSMLYAVYEDEDDGETPIQTIEHHGRVN